MSELTGLGDLFQIAVRNAEAMNPPENGDYLDEQGFLMCGRCHTRRQVEIILPWTSTDGDGADSTARMKVPISCRCRSEQIKQDELRRKQIEEMKALELLQRQSLMDERLRNASFNDFKKTQDNAYNLKLCVRYATSFDEMMEKNQGLLFYGGVGTGKTYAAACIANRLLQNKVPVIMTSFVKLLESMQGFREDNGELIARLNQAKLLIVDDLGAERGTDYALEKVYDIVDSRYRAKLPVIFTTNLSLGEMKDVADIRYSRIYDRIFELCYPMHFKGQSWRKMEAAKRYDDMRRFLEGDDG